MTVRACAGQRMGICEVGSDGRPIAGRLKPITPGFRLQHPAGSPVTEPSRDAALALQKATGPIDEPANPYFRC